MNCRERTELIFAPSVDDALVAVEAAVVGQADDVDLGRQTGRLGQEEQGEIVEDAGLDKVLVDDHVGDGDVLVRNELALRLGVPLAQSHLQTGRFLPAKQKGNALSCSSSTVKEPTIRLD